MSLASSLRCGRRRIARLSRSATRLAAVGGVFSLAFVFSPPAKATIDARYDPTNVVAGQPSVLAVQGVVDQAGPSWSITGALITLRFDPAKVTLSNFQSGPEGWSLVASNLDHVSEGWISVVLTNSDNDGQGQVANGPIVTFTVTPANGQVNAADCATLRLSGDESSLSDQDYYLTCPSDPCNGRNYPISDHPDEEIIRDGPLGRGGPTADALPDVASCIRVLRFVAGLTPPPDQHWNRGIDPASDPLWNTPTRSNFLVFTDTTSCPPKYINYHVNDINTKTPPNITVPPNTMVDQATLELTDPGGTKNGYVSGYDLTDWTVPACPPSFDGYGRHFTIADAIMALRLPLTGPPQAAWKAGFIGNILSGGFPANSTGMPAISLLKPRSAPSTPPDLSNPWIAAFPMGTQNGTNSPNPTADYNTNSMYLLSDLTGSGGYGFRSGWPRFLQDAPDGVSLADINGDGNIEVMAPNFQDAQGTHLFVWDHAGNGVAPFAPYDLNSAFGVGTGHSVATASVANITGDSAPELFFPYQGTVTVQGTQLGGVKIMAASGATLYTAQDYGDMSTPWSTHTGFFRAQFDAPPVLMKAAGGASRIVVAGANSGDIYAWRTDAGHVGEMQPGFPVQLSAPGSWTQNDIFDPVGYQISADVNNDSHPEVLFATGRHAFYADFDRISSYRHDDGALYCYSDDGQRLWRYPPSISAWKPAFASGLSIGRLRGPLGGLYVVAVDASGMVVALNAANGSVLWTYDIKPVATADPNNPYTKTVHRYFHGVVAQPLIADLNNDNNQDVIIGTTHGEVYILDGNPPSSQGRLLPGFAAPLHTFRSSDSITYIGGVRESQYEEVRGMALGPLNMGKPNHAILLVTSGRAGTTIPSQVGGHAMVFDLSDVLYPSTPENQQPETWHASGANVADWPQFQQNAHRTGYYERP